MYEISAMYKVMGNLFFLFVSISTYAQEPSVRFVDTTDKKNLLPLVKNFLLDQGRFSYHTPRGKVYILPYDNMPCLVPEMQSIAKMPRTMQPMPESRMPNALPRTEMIPKQKKP